MNSTGLLRIFCETDDGQVKDGNPRSVGSFVTDGIETNLMTGKSGMTEMTRKTTVTTEMSVMTPQMTRLSSQAILMMTQNPTDPLADHPFFSCARAPVDIDRLSQAVSRNESALARHWKMMQPHCL